MPWTLAPAAAMRVRRRSASARHGAPPAQMQPMKSAASAPASATLDPTAREPWRPISAEPAIAPTKPPQLQRSEPSSADSSEAPADDRTVGSQLTKPYSTSVLHVKDSHSSSVVA